MTSAPVTPEAVPEDDFDIDQWLTHATVTQGSVEILQRPDLLARWEDLERRVERAQAEKNVGERSAADTDPMLALRQEAEDLLQEIDASRTVFFVRALNDDDLSAIEAAHPVEKPPAFTAKMPAVVQNPTEKQALAFLGMWESYKLQKEQWDRENTELLAAHRAKAMEGLKLRGAEKIARATVKIVQGGRSTTKPLTADQVVSLSDKIGEVQTNRLLKKIDEVSAADPGVPQLDPLFGSSELDPALSGSSEQPEPSE